MFKMKNDFLGMEKSPGSPTAFNNNVSRVNSASVGVCRVNQFNTRQSPKIISGKMRENTSEQQKIHFSYLDVPFNKISRGTELPAQFERRDPSQLDNLMNKTIGNFRSTRIKVEEEKKTERGYLSKTGYEEEKNESLENNKKVERNASAMNITAKRTDQEAGQSNELGVANVTSSSSSANMDKWMPKSYKEYERLVKTAHSQRSCAQINLPSFSIEELKRKNYESDIFFNKKTEKINENFNVIRDKYHKIKGIDFQDSDVFMIKNNKTALNKNGEKYLNVDRKNKLFNVSSKSNSEWQPKNSYPSLLNHASTNYHILNPAVKHISKTREQIIKESDSFNPVYRQKSLCEFIDLTRVGVPNPNKEFLSAFKKSSNVFARNSNLCATYMDIHRLYKDISDKPFVKKIV